jgi:hypothetical protein
MNKQSFSALLLLFCFVSFPTHAHVLEYISNYLEQLFDNPLHGALPPKKPIKSDRQLRQMEDAQELLTFRNGQLKRSMARDCQEMMEEEENRERNRKGKRETLTKFLFILRECSQIKETDPSTKCDTVIEDMHTVQKEITEITSSKEFENLLSLITQSKKEADRVKQRHDDYEKLIQEYTNHNNASENVQEEQSTTDTQSAQDGK